MAATYGRLTSMTDVCLATLGPGATNLVTAAAYAQFGAMPMLMIQQTTEMIINAGHDVVEEPPFSMKPGGKLMFRVSFNTAEVDDVYFPQLELIGEMGKPSNKGWFLGGR